ncbi:hypothetical protein [Hydrogenophaga sp.]
MKKWVDKSAKHPKHAAARRVQMEKEERLQDFADYRPSALWGILDNRL